jgi:hypothetical protein
MHNTLDSSDYGLLDERDYKPRPNFWGAVLWRRLMGTTVLQPGASPSPDLYLYAHCLRGKSGGVTLLVINASSSQQILNIPKTSQRYTLTAPQLDSRNVQLNGRVLDLQANDTLPPMDGKQSPAGNIVFSSQSITFVGIPEAGNATCRR